MTHGDLLRRMSSLEFMQWRALYEAENDERKAAEKAAKSKKR
jgi:hypothetical protein